MAIICPTITAYTKEDYASELKNIEKIADRIHIDLTDGKFAPSRTINTIQVYWPENIKADIHLMFDNPENELHTLVSLQPNLVILHCEAKGDIEGTLNELKLAGIKTGIALLQDTPVGEASRYIEMCDHALVFSGNLGYHGGSADLSLLDKIDDIKSVNSDIEISWDGGINDLNIKRLVSGGVDVLNVGGFIQNSPKPGSAYAILEQIIDG